MRLMTLIRLVTPPAGCGLDLAYDSLHNITSKTQREVRYRPSGKERTFQAV